MSNQNAVVEVQGVTKIYDRPSVRGRSSRNRTPSGTKAVDGVSFDVARGELFVIMGLSGSGKSTMLRMLNRLIEPTSGTVRIGGHDITAMPAQELRRVRNKTIAMVFQHFALFPHRTVLENASYGLEVRGVAESERKVRGAWALDKVGLSRWGNVRPSELSGGMRQRVGLARALATDADILLMDEPFSALDPLIRKDMQGLLLELQSDLNKTIVFVTHDLNEAMRLGHRIMVMKDGRTIQLDTASEILAHPADQYVRQFTADVDRSRVIEAGTVMRPTSVLATEDEPAAVVLERVRRAGTEGTYVVHPDGTLHGVVLRNELEAAAMSNQQSLTSILRQDFDTVQRNTVLLDLLTRVGGKTVPLAVTDETGRLTGVLPRNTLLNSLAGTREHHA